MPVLTLTPYRGLVVYTFKLSLKRGTDIQCSRRALYAHVDYTQAVIR